MQFKPELALKVIFYDKNETRRIVKDGEAIVGDEHGTIYNVLDTNGRLKWRAGQDYAIQPGRGKPALGRRLLAEIRQERLQEITWDGAEAEGVTIPKHPVVEVGGELMLMRPPTELFAELWDSINTTPGTRWEDDPLVWVLVFGAVTERYEDRIAAVEGELQEAMDV